MGGIHVFDKMVAVLVLLLPAIATAIGAAAIVLVVRMVLEKRYGQLPDQQIKVHLTLLTLTLVAIPICVLTLPLSETQQGQLLGLIGILGSAALALAATTFLGNAMAGLMLRSVGSFHIGDFIRIGDHFGRVSDRGLFHVEIQTEDRDLTTLPNFFLVTNPVKVIRSSGTIVSSNVSLGYDAPRNEVETLLTEAAAAAELRDPFVLVMDLGDFSVTYRVAGVLTDVKGILSARSRLRQMVLDKLHGGGIEIVSPNFMNTRAIAEGRLFIPKPQETMQSQAEAAPEEVIFDKAEKAAIEQSQQKYESIGKTIESLREQSRTMDDKLEASKILDEIEELESRREALAASRGEPLTGEHEERIESGIEAQQ